MSPENALMVRASHVARTDPERWRLFVEAVGAYSAQQTQNCILSALDSLPVAQGRAQATARLYELLAGCMTGADKIESKAK